MSYALTRLAVADDLLKPTRPSWASANEAVRIAYYALFHYLIDKAVVAQLGRERTPAAEELRQSMTRWFQHRRMRDVASWFTSSGKVPEHIRSLLKHNDQQRTGIVPPELVSIAKTFIELQQSRHDADYDVAKRFTRNEAIEAVEKVRAAHAAWSKIATSAPARLFLTLLLFDDKVALPR